MVGEEKWTTDMKVDEWIKELLKKVKDGKIFMVKGGCVHIDRSVKID